MKWRKGKCYDDITAKSKFETFSESIDLRNTCEEVGKDELCQISRSVRKHWPQHSIKKDVPCVRNMLSN